LKKNAVFYWLALLIVIGVAIFTIQNSTVPLGDKKGDKEREYGNCRRN
jgi:hypothetical protein